MMMSHPAFAAIKTLDLAPVRERLLHPHAGPGWSEQRTRNAEAAYREFLLVAKLFPEESPVPSGDVDTFWHFHILDTIKYARDCASVFGHFLHHAPVTTVCQDQPSPARAALTTNRVIRMLSRREAANHGMYQIEATSESYCAVTQHAAASESYCAVAQFADTSENYCAVSNHAAQVEQSYCAVTAPSTAQAGTQLSYCALAPLGARPHFGVAVRQ